MKQPIQALPVHQVGRGLAPLMAQRIIDLSVGPVFRSIEFVVLKPVANDLLMRRGGRYHQLVKQLGRSDGLVQGLRMSARMRACARVRAQVCEL